MGSDCSHSAHLFHLLIRSCQTGRELSLSDSGGRSYCDDPWAPWNFFKWPSFVFCPAFVAVKVLFSLISLMVWASSNWYEAVSLSLSSGSFLWNLEAAIHLLSRVCGCWLEVQREGSTERMFVFTEEKYLLVRQALKYSWWHRKGTGDI